jgi:hypothetical protein
MAASVTIRPGAYYVYSHSIGRRVVYVGMGDSARPYETKNRSARWRSVVAGSEISVRILGAFDSKREALELELAKIKELHPAANTQGLPTLVLGPSTR